MQQQSYASIWQPFIYLTMIGFTFIAMPKSDSTYLLARCVQVVEVLFFITLLVQYLKQTIQINEFNWRANIWWLLYTVIAYVYTSSNIGLTPLFKWLNIIIFLLLGVCYWQHDMENSLRYISIVFSILIYLNALLLLIFPDGLWTDYEWISSGDPRRYLFGNYNQMGFVCLLGITAQGMYTFATKNMQFNLFLLIVISLGTVIYIGSMTSAVGLSLLGLYILLHKHIKHPKIYLIVFGIIYIIFMLVIVWAGNSIAEVDILKHFIENVLSKDTTFTRRTDIWSNAVYKIRQSPWIGYGVQDIVWNMRHINGSGPHNLWLLLLLHGGIVLCIAFIANVIFVIKKALQSQTLPSMLGVVSICVLFIMSLFEAYNLLQIFLLLQLVYYSPLLSNSSEPTND